MTAPLASIPRIVLCPTAATTASTSFSSLGRNRNDLRSPPVSMPNKPKALPTTLSM